MYFSCDLSYKLFLVCEVDVQLVKWSERLNRIGTVAGFFVYGSRKLPKAVEFVK